MASERLESKNDIASQDLHREGKTKLPSRADLQRFIAGHAAAAEAIWEEQRQRLEGLTVEQSRVEYDGLCEIWAANPYREGLESFEERRIEELLELRQRLDLVAQRGSV